MHRLVVSVAVVAAALVPTALFGPDAFAKSSSPPVKISGKVNAHGTGTATGGAVEIDQQDFDFSPTYISVPKGVTSVTVTVKNLGSTQHTFTVPSASIDVTLNPGQTTTETVPINQPGTLFFCRFHQSLGMQGAFFTKKGVKASSSSSSTKSTKAPSGGSGGGSSGGYGY
jgi:plastocyanin